MERITQGRVTTKILQYRITKIMMIGETGKILHTLDRQYNTISTLTKIVNCSQLLTVV